VGHTETVSTEDQTLTAALHGEALLTARRPEWVWNVAAEQMFRTSRSKRTLASFPAAQEAACL
jgi:hypothetical protein